MKSLSASASGPSDKDTQKSASASGPSDKDTQSAPGSSLGDSDRDSFEAVLKPMMMLWGFEEKMTIYSVNGFF